MLRRRVRREESLEAVVTVGLLGGPGEAPTRLAGRIDDAGQRLRGWARPCPCDRCQIGAHPSRTRPHQAYQRSRPTLRFSRSQLVWGMLSSLSGLAVNQDVAGAERWAGLHQLLDHRIEQLARLLAARTRNPTMPRIGLTELVRSLVVAAATLAAATLAVAFLESFVGSPTRRPCSSWSSSMPSSLARSARSSLRPGPSSSTTSSSPTLTSSIPSLPRIASWIAVPIAPSRRLGLSAKFQRA